MQREIEFLGLIRAKRELNCSLPDGIHPDAAGYHTIAANFVERVPREWLA